MRLSDSKNRRMLIMEQISIRQQSREKQRRSSAERRRKIQQNLNDFTQTMSNMSFKNTGNSSGFRYEHPYSERHGSYQELENPKPSQKQSLRQEYDNVLRSPSFKDIELGRESESKQQLSNESLNLSHFGNSAQQPGQEQDKKVEQQEIKPPNKAERQKQVKKVSPNPITENESSASAIFFTSQFNEFISNNHLSSRAKLEGQQLQENEADGNKIHGSAASKLQQGQQKQSPRKQRFSQMSANHGVPNQHQMVDHIAQENQQINHVPQTLAEQERRSTLLKNKSGHSLAFSNQSSLKYSLNESNIKQILNKKFANQLIADTLQFDPFGEDSSLYHTLKLQIIADKLLAFHRKAFFKQMALLVKIVQLEKKIQKREKRMYFEAFVIHHELIFQQKVNQIKCDRFLQEKEQQKLKAVFNDIKLSCFTLPRSKMDKAIQMEQKRQREMKQKIFRCLKIAWYDQKVKKQIQLYYLSKLFAHFARVIKAQKQAARNKCLAFYCSNLKKRYFAHLKQGIDNLQSQRMQRDNASWHYGFGLQRRVFEAWKDRLSYKDRYISLAMTTKNTFKETRDQKWMQIKTVDFKQIKYQ